MALVSIAWKKGAGADYHLVPGTVSPRFDRLLTITDTTGTRRADAPQAAGITVTWSASFARGAPGCAGVTVDTGTAANRKTGEVRVAAGALPAPVRLLDFLVIATVSDGVNPLPQVAYVRVHIHERVVSAWLTPSPLTARIGASNVRFGVLAEFDHGIVGDIGNWSPWEVDPLNPADLTYVRMLATNQPAVAWSSDNPSDLDADPKTGVLISNTDATSVTITAASGVAGATAVGTASGGAAWSEGAVVEPIGGPGIAGLGTVPNMLILGDGFAAAELPAFLRHARHAVDELHKNTRLHPYPWLKGRIKSGAPYGLNWFAAMLDSPQPGVTALNPVDVVPRAGAGVVKDVDVAVTAAAAPGLAPTIAAPVANATRFLLDERDTAFGTSLGERPRAQRQREMRTAVQADRRLSDADFNAFLQNLKKPDLTALGGQWHSGGKDEGSIVILCRMRHFGGANRSRVPSGHAICGGLGRESTYRMAPVAPGQQKVLVPDAVPAASELVLHLRMAHELGHSFTLGDEYGTGRLPAAKVPIADARSNVQSRVSVVDGAGVLDETKIKWAHWPRILKAGVLAAATPPAPGATFVVDLDPGHAKPFAVGDVVRLRTRPLPASVQSGRLEVVSKPSEAQLELRRIDPFAGTFPAKSIVMEPKRAPDVGGALGADLMLVHARVLDHIKNAGRKNPLNAAFGSPQDRPCPGPPPAPGTPVYNFSTPALNFGPGNAPVPPLESAWIAGLWEKGETFGCDVYHPTGACIMNVYSYDGYVSSFQFCWICRYAIVDHVDPTLHYRVDNSYWSRYPT